MSSETGRSATTDASPASGAPRSDEELMARAQADDTAAFAELYDRHCRSAFRIARSVCRDTGRAEDAVQEGFFTVWRGRASYQPESGSFRAWSMRIVHNRAIDSTRAAAIRPPVQGNVGVAQADESAASTPDGIDARIEADALLASLAKLPTAQAEVLVLAYYGELSQSEIAAQLSIPQGTVKGRMRLGLEKLRREMGYPGSRHFT